MTSLLSLDCMDRWEWTYQKITASVVFVWFLNCLQTELLIPWRLRGFHGCVLFCMGLWEQHSPLCCSGADGQPELVPLPLCPGTWLQLTVLWELYSVFNSHPGACSGSARFGNEGLKGSCSRVFYKRDEWAVNSTGGAGILVQTSKAGSVAVKNSDNWWQCILRLICFWQTAARAGIYSRQIAVSWKFDQASRLWLSQWRALPSADIHLPRMWNIQAAKCVFVLEFWSPDMFSREAPWSMVIAAGTARQETVQAKVIK